jgi:Domain of unknown function (DUF4386)
MKTQKKPAIIIGILFLIALILNLIASEMLNPILDHTNYLTQAYPKRNLIVVGNLLNIVCAVAMTFIPIVLFSTVSQRHKPRAAAYIVFRALEGVLFFYMAINTFRFIDLSKAYIDTTNEVFLIFGQELHSHMHWAMIAYLISFCSGAFLFYSLLFKSQLVPKWLAVWGLTGTALLAVGTLLGLFEWGIFKTMPLMQGMVYFAPLIALNEFVLSCWLIVKGFHVRD